jgi:hypothetical protein
MPPMVVLALQLKNAEGLQAVLVFIDPLRCERGAGLQLG